MYILNVLLVLKYLLYICLSYINNMFQHGLKKIIFQKQRNVLVVLFCKKACIYNRKIEKKKNYEIAKLWNLNKKKEYIYFVNYYYISLWNFFEFRIVEFKTRMSILGGPRSMCSKELCYRYLLWGKSHIISLFISKVSAVVLNIIWLEGLTLRLRMTTIVILKMIKRWVQFKSP